MSNLTFKAKVFHFSKEDFFIVGFADDEYEYQNYIIMQKAFNFDEQDISLGMDGEYIEVNGDSSYKVCTKATLKNYSFSIECKVKDSTRIIEVLIDEITLDKLIIDYLCEILGEKLVILE